MNELEQKSHAAGVKVKNQIYRVVLVLAVFGGFRCLAFIGKVNFSHDGVISYLHATGNFERYCTTLDAAEAPYGRWVKVSTWQQFWEIQRPFCFGTIRETLSGRDIHPPLYFWTLHLWSLVFGVSVPSAIALNAVFDLFTVWLIFLIGRQCFQHRIFCFSAMLIWMTSPSVLEATMLARQYSLLGFMTALHAYSVIIFLQNPRQRILFIPMIVLSGMAGMLTHHHFMFILAGCFFYMIFVLRKSLGFEVVTALSYFAIGLMTYLVYPACVKQIFYVAGRQSSEFQWSEVPIRLLRVVYALFPSMFKIVPAKSPGLLYLSYGTAIVIVGMAAFVLVRGLRHKPIAIKTWVTKEQPCLLAIVFLLCWISFFVILPYLLCKTPQHAMGGRYLIMIWPFLAVVLAGVLERSQRIKTAAVYAPLLWVLVCLGMILLIAVHGRIKNLPASYAIAQNYTHFIVDNTAPGVSGRILLKLPEDKSVFMASQKDLLDSCGVLGDFPAGQTAWLSNLSYKSTREGREGILERLSKEYKIEEESYNFYGFERKFFDVAQVFVFAEKEAEP